MKKKLNNEAVATDAYTPRNYLLSIPLLVTDGFRIQYHDDRLGSSTSALTSSRHQSKRCLNATFITNDESKLAMVPLPKSSLISSQAFQVSTIKLSGKLVDRMLFLFLLRNRRICNESCAFLDKPEVKRYNCLNYSQ